MADGQPAQHTAASKVAQPKGFLSRLFAAGPLMPQQQMSPAASAAQDHKLDDKHEDFHPGRPACALSHIAFFCVSMLVALGHVS